jgi:hypothetical protein
MIRVTVEILPGGFETGKRTLGVMHIANDASGDRFTGNYNVRMFGVNGLRQMGATRIEGFKRTSGHAWELVHEALASIMRRRARYRKWMRG